MKSGPTGGRCDSRRRSYSKVIADAQAMKSELEVDFMLISVGSLLRDIQEHARAWVTAIAKLMNSMCRQELMDLHELIGEFSANLDRNPDTLDDLKFILNMVAEIQARSMEMELQYSVLEEKYRTLRMYQYPVTDEEAELFVEYNAGLLSLGTWAPQYKRGERALDEVVMPGVAVVRPLELAVVEVPDGIHPLLHSLQRPRLLAVRALAHLALLSLPS